jgi:hypothetical protein
MLTLIIQLDQKNHEKWNVRKRRYLLAEEEMTGRGKVPAESHPGPLVMLRKNAAESALIAGGQPHTSQNRIEITGEKLVLQLMATKGQVPPTGVAACGLVLSRMMTTKMIMFMIKVGQYL